MSYTPPTESELADWIYNWANGFIKRSQDALARDARDQSAALRRKCEAEASDQRSEDDCGGFQYQSPLQIYDQEMAKINASIIEHTNHLKNAEAMVSFIQQLVEDVAKRRTMSADEMELVQWKAEKAASKLFEREIHRSSAEDLIPNSWVAGWVVGYLHRKGEESRKNISTEV